jgi:hypothetical protein
MAYNGSEGGTISRAAARALMSNYRNSPAFSANNQIEGILFGKDHIENLLAQPGCTGIRIYYGKEGITNNDPPKLILVGFDIDGNDMSNLIVDLGFPCPTHCSSSITKI